MSEKENLRKWVASKLETRAEKVQAAGGDEEKVLLNYLMALDGASQALEAAGVPEEARKIVEEAIEIISEDYDAIKKKAERQKKLDALLKGKE